MLLRASLFRHGRSTTSRYLDVPCPLLETGDIHHGFSGLDTRFNLPGKTICHGYVAIMPQLHIQP